MARARQTWDVVATVDEAPELIVAFVAWHLDLGAARIHLFFDRPGNPAAEMLADRPGVTLHHPVLDDPKRPRRHQRRQLHNATQAYRDSAADWLLHCDADELLWADEDVGAVLADTQDRDALRIGNLERYYPSDAPTRTIFDGTFRAPFPGRVAEGEARFGPDYALTRRGLTGYANGKSFSRTGLPLRINIHKPQIERRSGWTDVRAARSEALRLLHYDGLTPLHWMEKLLRKAHATAFLGGAAPTAHRRAQIAEVLDEVEAAGAARRIHDRLKVLSPEREAQLNDMGLRHDPVPDPAAAIARQFPDLSIDLGPERHDAWLRAERAELFETYAL